MFGLILSFLSNLFGCAMGTVLSSLGIAGLANSEIIQEGMQHCVQLMPSEVQAQLEGCEEYATSAFGLATTVGTTQLAGHTCSMYREATQKNEIKSKDAEIRNLKDNLNHLYNVNRMQALQNQSLKQGLDQALTQIDQMNMAANMAG